MLDSLNQNLFMVTASSGKQRSGMIVTWVTLASLDTERPRVILVLSPRNLTTGLLLKSRRFTLSLLSKADLDLVDRFGARSGRDLDKFGGLARRFTTTRRYRLPSPRTALSVAEGQVTAVASTGDRLIVVASIRIIRKAKRKAKPLVMADLRRLGPAERARARAKLLNDLRLDRRQSRLA